MELTFLFVFGITPLSLLFSGILVLYPMRDWKAGHYLGFWFSSYLVPVTFSGLVSRFSLALFRHSGELNLVSFIEWRTSGLVSMLILSLFAGLLGLSFLQKNFRSPMVLAIQLLTVLMAFYYFLVCNFVYDFYIFSLIPLCYAVIHIVFFVRLVRLDDYRLRKTGRRYMLATLLSLAVLAGIKYYVMKREYRQFHPAETNFD